MTTHILFTPAQIEALLKADIRTDTVNRLYQRATVRIPFGDGRLDVEVSGIHPLLRDFGGNVDASRVIFWLDGRGVPLPETPAALTPVLRRLEEATVISDAEAQLRLGVIVKAYLRLAQDMGIRVPA
ncbi:hypothetical protein [Thiomonas sp.]